MKISIITLFPEVFQPILNTSILKRAQQKNKIGFEMINLRDFGEGKHQTVDDRPYGGGAGMILKADVLAKALKHAVKSGSQKNKLLAIHHKPYTILTSASGTLYNQSKALKLSKLDHIILICGHYEGVDQRFIDEFVDEEISIGDYVLTGGEIPAMVIIDSITRLIPGVLEKPEATQNESFSNYTLYPKPYIPRTLEENSAYVSRQIKESSAYVSRQMKESSAYTLIEYPHYTRPEVFAGKKVPEVLLSGNHQKIEKWRKEQALKKTKKVRPDLLTPSPPSHTPGVK